MTVVGKLVALLVSITIFAMPTMTMPFHCVLMTGSGGNADHCHMTEKNSGADQKRAPVDHRNTPPANHSCCQASGAMPESLAVQRALADIGMVVPPGSAVFSGLLAVTLVRVPFDRNAQSLAGPPQALLCTFLI